MPAMLYLYDGAAVGRRVGPILTGLGTMLFFAGMLLFGDDQFEPTRGGVAFVLLALVVTGVDIYIALTVRQGTTDGLRLDAECLTRIGGGREVRWAWRDLSAFRLHSRFHPATLVLGQCISFRAEGAGHRKSLLYILNGVLFFGATNVIGANYFVLPEELADRLNGYRRAANADQRHTRRPLADLHPIPAPALFFANAAMNNRYRLRLLLFLGLGLLLAVGVIATALLFLEHSWPNALDLLLKNGLAFYMALPILLVPAIYVVLALWMTSPVSNLLLATAGGLFLRQRLAVSRQWTWTEIFETELNHYPSRFWTSRTDWTIGLTGAHDGTNPGRPTDDGEPYPTIVFTLQDNFNAPLAEIMERLHDWTAWHAQFGPGTPKDVRGRVRYMQSPNLPGNALEGFLKVILPTLGFVTLLLLVLIFFMIPDESLDPLLVFLIVPMFLILMLQAVALSAMQAKGWNYLELNAEGLTWRRVGLSRRWSWRELPSFELRMAKARWHRKPTAVILFNGHDDDRLSRFLRWAYRIDEALPRIVIEDIYDSPIQEVLARLKIYRRPPRFGHAAHRGHVPEFTQLEAF